MMYNLFFELLQLALGTRDRLSRAPSPDEWTSICQESQRPAILGLMVEGLERLPKEQLPKQGLLLQWIGLPLQIESQNCLLNKRCHELQQVFSEAGFACCILKGHGNALYYPKSEVRQSGDIDIWAFPKLKIDNGELTIKPIIDFLRTKCDIGK